MKKILLLLFIPCILSGQDTTVDALYRATAWSDSAIFYFEPDSTDGILRGRKLYFINLQDSTFKNVIRAESAKYTSFADAIDSANATANSVLWVRTTMSLTENDTIDSDVSLVIPRGGSISITSGDTLWIHGTLNKGEWQMFTGDGEIRLGDNIQIVYLEWFGAVGDGSTNDYTAIAKAERALNVTSTNQGKTIQFLGKHYIMGSTLTLTNEYTVFNGAAGRLSSKLSISADDTLLNINGKDYIKINNVMLIGKAGGTTHPTLFVPASSHFFNMENVFVNNGKFNLKQTGGSYAVYENCQFETADSANVFLNAKTTGILFSTFRDCRFLIADYGYVNVGDWGGGSPTTVDDWLIDNPEFSQIDTMAIVIDSTGQGKIKDGSISAGNLGIKVNRSFPPLKVEGLYYESSGSTETFGAAFEFSNMTGVQIANIKVGNSATDGVGLKINNSNGVQIVNANISGDSIAVWSTGVSSKNNDFTNVTASNFDIGFLEDNSAGRNTYKNCYAKDLQEAGTIPWSISHNSRVDGRVSGSVDAGVEDPFITGEGSIENFLDGNPTPPVNRGTFYHASNTPAITYTAFDSAFGYGKQIYIKFTSADTVDFSGTNLKGNGGVDWIASSGDWLHGFWDGTNWYCSIEPATSGRETATRLTLESAFTTIDLKESDAGANLKNWRITANGNALIIYSSTDDLAASNPNLKFTRSAENPLAAQFYGYVILSEKADPSTPASSFGALNANTSGTLDYINDVGTKYSLTAGGSPVPKMSRIISFPDSVKAGDEFWMGLLTNPIAPDSIYTFTDQGTVTFNVEDRANTTPKTAGTDILSTDITADTNGQFASNFASGTYARLKIFYLVVTSVTGDPTELGVAIWGDAQ